MSRTKRYEGRTGYVPYAERRFFVDAVHRPEPDLGVLTELFIRLTLERVAEAREQREGAKPPSSFKSPQHL